MTDTRTQRAEHRRQGEAPPAPEPLSVPVLDSHTHLDIVGGEPALVIAAARAAGVDRLVQVGCDVPSSRWGVSLAATEPAVVATVALHPNEAPRLAARGAAARGPAARGAAALDPAALDPATLDPATLDPADRGPAALDEALRAIEGLASHERVRGIGETGLDTFRTGDEGRPAQETSFRAHIAFAKRFGKPLVVHDRDAHADILRVLDSEGAPDVVVMHCFSGDGAFAAECVRRGFVLSFAGTVTFKNAAGLRDAVRVTPLAQLLVETDAPYLTPMPYRGRPNAPYLVPLTVRAIAGQLDRDLDEVCAGISATGERVFGPWSGRTP